MGYDLGFGTTIVVASASRGLSLVTTHILCALQCIGYVSAHMAVFHCLLYRLVLRVSGAVAFNFF
jgi:hypothetical protein